MNWFFICIAIIGIFLYYNRNKVVYPSNLPETQQYIRLWLIPFLQLLICSFFLLGAKMHIQMLLSESPFMSQAIKDNLGIFSSIASDVFNDYRTERLAPYIEKMNEVHKYAIYLFYGSIASFILYIYVLKNKVCSKDFVLYFSVLFSAIILIIGYIYNYNSELSSSAILSTETLGLWSTSKGKATESAIDTIGTLGLFLFFIHYYQKVWLLQYYDGVEAKKRNNDEKTNEQKQSEENIHDNRYQNLKNLKTLLDSGVLTQEEFDQQKKEILNS